MPRPALLQRALVWKCGSHVVWLRVSFGLVALQHYDAAGAWLSSASVAWLELVLQLVVIRMAFLIE